MNIFKKIEDHALKIKEESYGLEEYLDRAKQDKSYYATVHERLLKAIGEPELVDTTNSRIYHGKILRRYPAFIDLYGIEPQIEQVVSYLVHASRNLEAKRQILVLLGNVGSGKSTIVKRLIELSEQEPIFVLTSEEGVLSPVFESPLALFYGVRDHFEKEYKISSYRIPEILSPWALKRLKEYKGDIKRFKVTRIYPSSLNGIAVGKVEPSDDNNADISALVGQVDLSKLEKYSRSDPDCYLYTGALCKGNQGITEMVEMLKAPKKTLYPLSEAVQGQFYAPKEHIGQLPFYGMAIGHTNGSEFTKYMSDKTNEALIDRMCVIKIPYCTGYSDEVKVLQKMLNNSDLKSAPLVLDTLDILAKFAVMTRLEDTDVSDIYSKMRVYNNDDVKGDNKAESYEEYKKQASQDEGMAGRSTRSNFKLLEDVYDADPLEVSADPVTLFLLLEQDIKKQQLGDDEEEYQLSLIDSYLKPKYKERLEKEIQKAYIEGFGDYAQAKFDRYFALSRAFCDEIDYRDPVTGATLDKESILRELQNIEKPAGITNAADFRAEIVRYILGKKVDGITVKWDSYAKLGDAIGKIIFKKMEDIIPVISFGTKSTSREQKDHDTFVAGMQKLGYTKQQIVKLVTWYLQVFHS